MGLAQQGAHLGAEGVGDHLQLVVDNTERDAQQRHHLSQVVHLQ
jgi:hypothetical protein